MNAKFALMTVLVAVGVSSCTIMTPEQCITSNWFAVGEQDGSRGTGYRIDRYYKACQKVQVVPNQALYQKGYEKGLSYYCQPEHIFDLAMQGQGGYTVCPLEHRQQLKPYYDVAYRYYNDKKAFDQFNDDLEHYQNLLLDKKLSPEKRNQYIDKIEELKKNQNRIYRDYKDAEYSLNQFMDRTGL